MSYTAGTYNAKPSTVSKRWYVIDAANMVLGRLAAEVAKILRGKHKAYFTPHINCGDHVVIVNAEKVAITGKKDKQMKRFWHTGYPGGIKEITAGKILSGRFPERLIEKAIERMMPKESPLANNQMKSLYVYKGAEHPHQAQNPQALDLSARNSKNKRSE